MRGCIGHVAADRELGAVVREMAVAAARDDPRFAPVSREELPSLALEISVLSEPTPLPAPVAAERITVGRDGLIVRRERLIALLLPQVAREYHWGPEAFLAATCRKAGLPPDAWREAATEVLTFQADVEPVPPDVPARAGPGTGVRAAVPRVHHPPGGTLPSRILS